MVSLHCNNVVKCMKADHKMPNCENEARHQYRCAFWIHAFPDCLLERNDDRGVGTDREVSCALCLVPGAPGALCEVRETSIPVKASGQTKHPDISSAFYASHGEAIRGLVPPTVHINGEITWTGDWKNRTLQTTLEAPSTCPLSCAKVVGTSMFGARP